MKLDLFVICSHLLAFVLLMQGLFPFSSPSHSIANRSCFDSHDPPRGRMVLMMIDALRADYVLNNNHSYHLKSIARLREKGHAEIVQLRTHTPTVTLPRLKALLTGTVPSFWDVLFNYNSTRLELDNLLTQYKRKYPTKKIVFYGDDTWLKLFPDSIFDRAQGLQSFFVTDFHEIDLNVTRDLYWEIEEMNDWNILIVHYLGLDHIGHASGAFNSLVKEKLSEMDQVIDKVFSSLTDDDLLLITGDHGMADQGGHGGASYVETHVPAVFLSPRLSKKQETDVEEWLQIDLTPTLSALLHIPIPSNSVGILMENVLRRLFPSASVHLLRCLVDDNRRQLSDLLPEGQSSPLTSLQSLRDRVMLESNEQDLRLLLLSIVLFWCSTAVLFFDVDGFSLASILLSVASVTMIYAISGEIFIATGVTALIVSLTWIVKGTQKQWNRPDDNRLSSRFVSIYPYVHLVSLFSSSFIEEEHQTWYYFLITYLLLLAMENLSIRIIALMILCRLLRSWNQTGDKWLSTPDIGDMLNASENRSLLLIVHLISSIVFVYLWNDSRQRLSSVVLVLLSLIYRWNLLGSSSEWTPGIYYLLLLVLAVVGRLSLVEMLFSLTFLLSRPHNSFIVIGHLILYRYLDVKDSRLAILLSQAAFFHLGNSNSFVTIDVSYGFVGVPVYLPVIHGLLIYLGTFGLSMVWLTKVSSDARSLIQLTLINSSFASCVFLQRYHLFVWTVFAPKVFYLTAHTASNLILFFLINNRTFLHGETS